MKEIITSNAPKAVGPYSQAVKARNLVFCSGQIGLDPQTNTLVKGGIEQETKQIFNNLLQVLKAAKVNFSNVLRVDIFLTNINDFPKVNQIYSQYFTSNIKPARQTVAVKSLPKEALIEISCIAYIEK
ncbi:RidA family protein [Candidatus Daviesbacteria bacterium]|nr:RidA family protein [Candidatus Daviesbacteria bacterium]